MVLSTPRLELVRWLAFDHHNCTSYAQNLIFRLLRFSHDFLRLAAGRFLLLDQRRRVSPGLATKCLSRSSSTNPLEAHDSDQVVDGISKIFFTLSISLASLFLGVHIGTTLLPFIPKMGAPPAAVRHTISVVSVTVYLATFPVYFYLSPSFRHKATAALLFSFPGTFTRYVLSISLNSRWELFPVGTLVANEFGTALLALSRALQGLRTPVSPGACSILQGLGDGYCGCLTTVSTFAAELRGQVGGKRWLYGTISIVVGQVVVVLILGSTVWTGTASAQMSCRSTM